MTDIEKLVANDYGVDPSRVQDQAESGRTKAALPLRIEIPGKPPSLNDFYSGMHWSERNRVKDKWHRKTAQFAPDVEIVDYPVQIEVVALFGKGRRYDVENLAVASKLITDALEEIGLLHGDNPKYIRRVSLECRKHSGEGHFVDYTITNE